MSAAPELDPYVGPRPFGRDDRQRFFGRDRESDDLLSLVLAHPVVLVYAASGAGKSSLLNAGLIPGLEDEGFHVLGSARVAGPLPADAGRIANRYLFHALSRWNSEQADLGLDLQELAGMTLQNFLQRLDQQCPGKARALIFDQFEEFFSYHVDKGDQRQAFIGQIAAALHSGQRLRIVFALREEYVVQFEPFVYQLPDKLRTRMRLEPLRGREAMEAIRKPVEALDLQFERGEGENDPAEALVTELRKIHVDGGPNGPREVIGEFVEPLQLQVVCENIWRNLPPEVKAYAAERQSLPAEIKREKKIITRMQMRIEEVDDALSQHYDRAIADAVHLSGVSEGELRRWLSDCLISGAGLRRIALAEDKSTERLPKAALEVLKEQRVIRDETRDGSVWYELTHDRFIEPIQTSNRAWFEQRAPSDVLRRKLESRAVVAGARLDEVELREAEQFLQTPEATLLGTTDAVKAFVRASRERVDEDHRHKERELKDAQKLARWAGVATLLAIVVLGVAIYAWVQKGKAEQSERDASKQREAEVNQRHKAHMAEIDAQNQREEAVKQSKAAQSLKAAWRGVNVAPEKLDLALLLSAEAFRRDGGQEAKNALLESLLASPHVNSFLRGHSAETTVASLAFSPDGQTLASADGTGTIILWNPDTGFMVREPISAHKEYIYSIAFSPDGRQLASASQDKTVRLVNIASGAVEKLGEDANFDFRGVAFSSDGKVLAAACGDGSVRLWNIASKQQIASLVDHERQAAAKDVQVEAVAFSPNDKLLVSAGDDDHLVLWDVDKAKKKQTIRLQDEERPVFQVVFSPDGKWIATGSARGSITLWSAEKLDRAYGPAVKHDRGIYGLEFSPDGKMLASASADQSARLWDVAAMTTHRNEPSTSLDGYSEGVYSIAFRPDSDMLATGHADGTVTLWNLSNQPRLADRIEAISGDVNALAFGPDGKLLVSAQGKAIALWDAGNRNWQTDALQGHQWPVTSVAVSPRGSLIASASQDMTIRLWDNVSGRQLGPSLKGHAGSVNAVAFSPRGDLLASASEDKTIRLWKIGEQRPDGIDTQLMAELTGHTDAVLCVAFSPDGNTLASGGSDKTVRLWDVQSGRQIGQPLAKHAAAVFRVAFQWDGKRLASGDRDGSLILWDRGTGQPLSTKFAGHDGASVIGLAFHPNGKTLLSAGYHSKVIQWSLDSGKAIGPPLTDLGSEVTSLAVGPNGSVLAAGSMDTVNILQLTGAKPVGRTLECALQGVWSLAISHDGATLAASGNRGNIICWNTKTRQQKGIPLKTDAKGITRLLFSHDDRILGAVSEKRIVFWDLATGKETGRLVEESKIRDAVFDPVGERLATGTDAGAVNLWDWPSLKRRAEQLESHKGGVRSLVFSPDGQRLFSCGDDSKSMQHDLSTASPTSTPLECYDAMRMAWSPDGKTFALGEADGPIDIYDASLHRIGILKYHKGPIAQLAFSPDGKELASTSWDHLGRNTIMLFDVKTRQPIGPPLNGHKGDISGVLFGDEGKTMFSSDYEGVIFRWDVNVDSWQTQAASIAGRGLTKDEAMEYLGEPSPPPLSDPATLLKRADAAALKKAPDARALFGEAVKAAITSKDPEVSNNLCWYGSVDHFADVVLPAGDREVEIADEEKKPFYRDTRGLARALAGKKQEAIEDFLAFIAWAESHKLYEDNVSMRKEWIKEMKENKNPFTDEMLRKLRAETYGFDLD